MERKKKVSNIMQRAKLPKDVLAIVESGFAHGNITTIMLDKNDKPFMTVVVAPDDQTNKLACLDHYLNDDEIQAAIIEHGIISINISITNNDFTEMPCYLIAKSELEK